MVGKTFLSQQNLADKHQQAGQYLNRMRWLYQYDLQDPYASFNGSIACLSTKGIKKWLITMPSWRLAVMTIYKLVMLLLVGVYALIKSSLKGYPFANFSDYYFFFFRQANAQYLDRFNDDAYFGLQRVSGPNPTWIKGLTVADDILENFAVADTVASLTGLTYTEALENQRLYLADYSALEVMTEQLKTLANGRQQYITNPLALFYRQDDGLLKPLAIKLYGTKPTGDQNPIYTPNHGNHWTMAKMFVQNADVVAQNCWTHSVRTHYLIGSLVLATYRQLLPSHPLFKLLQPHWQDTLAVNTLVRYYRPSHAGGKIPPFGMVLPCQQDTLADFMGEGMKTYSFKGMAFPQDLQQQHLSDPDLFFPYRDDGKLVWDAIHQFVRQYVTLYYQSDRDVANDSQLQAWADEISGSLTENKMGITDFPRRFNTIDEVVETVGNIIFITTAQHNCVHYSLYQYVAFAPNMPFSLMSPPNTDLETPLSSNYLSQLMPPLKNVLVQSLGFYLNYIQTKKIGDYKLSQFEPAARAAIKDYQQKLATIGEEIEQRNQERDALNPDLSLRYDLMNPRYMANSITS
ncbi:MAG: lipoxygenase family protein [Cyanobacteria bacterium J06623_7]